MLTNLCRRIAKWCTRWLSDATKAATESAAVQREALVHFGAISVVGHIRVMMVTEVELFVGRWCSSYCTVLRLLRSLLPARFVCWKTYRPPMTRGKFPAFVKKSVLFLFFGFAMFLTSFFVQVLWLSARDFRSRLSSLCVPYFYPVKMLRCSLLSRLIRAVPQFFLFIIWSDWAWTHSSAFNACMSRSRRICVNDPLFYLHAVWR